MWQARDAGGAGEMGPPGSCRSPGYVAVCHLALSLLPPLVACWPDNALTLTWSFTKEALPLGQPGRRPPAPQPQPRSSLLKSEPRLSTREWLRPHHRAMGRRR